MRNEGKILNRSQLVKALWKDEAYINEKRLIGKHESSSV